MFRSSRGSAPSREQLQEVHEKVSDIIKQLANEPSVGLYYVQQHVQTAVPALVDLKHQLRETSEAAVFAIDDVRGATASVRTMRTCGPSKLQRMTTVLDAAARQLDGLQRGKGSQSSSRLGTLQRLSPARVFKLSPTKKRPATTAGNSAGGEEARGGPTEEEASTSASAAAEDAPLHGTTTPQPHTLAEGLLQGPGTAQAGGTSVATPQAGGKSLATPLAGGKSLSRGRSGGTPRAGRQAGGGYGTFQSGEEHRQVGSGAGPADTGGSSWLGDEGVELSQGSELTSRAAGL